MANISSPIYGSVTPAALEHNRIASIKQGKDPHQFPLKNGWDKPAQTDFYKEKPPFQVVSYRETVGPFKIGGVEKPNSFSRDAMEDTHLHISLPLPQGPACLFTVFDGHGNDQTARYLEQHFPKTLTGFLKTVPLENKFENKEAIANALQTACLAMDNSLYILAKTNKEFRFSGSTAVIALAIKNDLFIANLGDARIIRVTADGETERLSYDHKPDLPEETERIHALAGLVSRGRVVGTWSSLAISRAFGDPEFKHPADVYKSWVSPVPFINHVSLTPGDRLVLACDGLWDIIPDDAVAGIIRPEADEEAQAVALAKAAFFGINDARSLACSSDNISVIIANFNQS